MSFVHRQCAGSEKWSTTGVRTKKLVVSFEVIGYNSIASRNAGLDYGSLVGLVQWKPVNRVRIER